MNGLIIIDDKRYDYAKSYLKARGHSFADCPAEHLDFIIFPFKEKTDDSIFNAKYFGNLSPKTLIFSGVRQEYLEEQARAFGLNYHPILDDEAVRLKNAVPTSEGIISYIIANRNQTINGSRVLIIGYGVCGRDLGQRLGLLGAEVYAVDTSKKARAAAWADSAKNISMADIRELEFDIVVNTAQIILAREQIEKMGKALLINIASKPYGFDDKDSVFLPSIPGRYAIKTAGEILGEYIDSILKGGERL